MAFVLLPNWNSITLIISIGIIWKINKRKTWWTPAHRRRCCNEVDHGMRQCKNGRSTKRISKNRSARENFSLPKSHRIKRLNQPFQEANIFLHRQRLSLVQRAAMVMSTTMWVRPVRAILFIDPLFLLAMLCLPWSIWEFLRRQSRRMAFERRPAQRWKDVSSNLLPRCSYQSSRRDGLNSVLWFAFQIAKNILCRESSSYGREHFDLVYSSYFVIKVQEKTHWKYQTSLYLSSILQHITPIQGGVGERRMTVIHRHLREIVSITWKPPIQVLWSKSRVLGGHRSMFTREALTGAQMLISGTFLWLTWP